MLSKIQGGPKSVQITCEYKADREAGVELCFWLFVAAADVAGCQSLHCKSEVHPWLRIVVS